MENIDKICRKLKIENYTINSDGTIDVDGSVNLYALKLTKLPLKFNYVSGSFDCSYNQLKTLEGCPKEVGINFNCNSNCLSSLEFSPEKVGGGFYCIRNRRLKNLEGVGEFYYMFSDILNGDVEIISNHLLDIKLKRLLNI